MMYMAQHPVYSAMVNPSMVSCAMFTQEDPICGKFIPGPNLNNGQWHLRDINYYRRFVTNGAKTAAKQQLADLMGMNETNETELLLLTPLTAAPTPMPPTPAPTPIPQDVVTTVDIGAITKSAAEFAADQTAILTAMGFEEGVAAVIEFVVEAVAEMNPVPTEDEAKHAFATLWAVSADSVGVVVTAYRRLKGERHLQSGGGSVTAT